MVPRTEMIPKSAFGIYFGSPQQFGEVNLRTYRYPY